MSDHVELEAELARARAAEAKVEALEIQLGLRPPVPTVREVVRPRTFTVERGTDDLAVSWRWSPQWFTGVFAAVWNGGLIQAAVDVDEIPALAVLFFVVFFGIGAVLALVALASFINRTTIRTRDRLLEVVHGPIPIRRRRVVAAIDVQRLQAVKSGPSESGPSEYKLTALLGDDRQRTLVGELTDDEARFLEVAFEEQLGIER